MTQSSPQDPDAARDLLLEVERAIGALQQHHGPQVAALVNQLLADVDAVHRAGLTHLMDAIRSMAGDAFVNRLVADPAIRMLLMSYDLVAVDRRLMAEEALDTVRGHLHAHGIDVEILEVVGGVVYVRLHGVTGAGVPEAEVARDLEMALRTGFLGFQELVTRGRQPSTAVIPISLLRANKPVYRDVCDADGLSAGAMKAFEIEGHFVLIVRTPDEWLAVSNRCGESPLPLEFGRVDGTTLHCSWHGCQYDIRTGARIDGAGERLRVFPIRVDDGKVRIAIDVSPA